MKNQATVYSRYSGQSRDQKIVRLSPKFGLTTESFLQIRVSKNPAYRDSGLSRVHCKYV